MPDEVGKHVVQWLTAKRSEPTLLYIYTDARQQTCLHEIDVDRKLVRVLAEPERQLAGVYELVLRFECAHWRTLNDELRRPLTPGASVAAAATFAANEISITMAKHLQDLGLPPLAADELVVLAAPDQHGFVVGLLDRQVRGAPLEDIWCRLPEDRFARSLKPPGRVRAQVITLSGLLLEPAYTADCAVLPCEYLYAPLCWSSHFVKLQVTAVEAPEPSLPAPDGPAATGPAALDAPAAASTPDNIGEAATQSIKLGYTLAVSTSRGRIVSNHWIDEDAVFSVPRVQHEPFICVAISSISLNIEHAELHVVVMTKPTKWTADDLLAFWRAVRVRVTKKERRKKKEERRKKKDER